MVWFAYDHRLLRVRGWVKSIQNTDVFLSVTACVKCSEKALCLSSVYKDGDVGFYINRGKEAKRMKKKEEGEEEEGDGEREERRREGGRQRKGNNKRKVRKKGSDLRVKKDTDIGIIRIRKM